MKEKMKKISDVLKLVFGYGIMIALFMGLLVFLGYVIALIAGGDTAVVICDFRYFAVWIHLPEKLRTLHVMQVILIRVKLKKV